MLNSPRKLPLAESSDEDEYFTPTSSPRKLDARPRSPTKRDKVKVEAKKAFEKEKHAIAQAFLDDLELKIDKGEIKQLTEASGGIKIIWSKKLNSTAGRANWKREGRRVPNAEGKTVVEYRHTASIELAAKVIDEEREYSLSRE